MRKTNILALLVLLCACSVPSPYSDLEKTTVSVVLETQYPVYAPDVEEIGVTIRNHSGEMIEYGADWSMEVKRGGGWMTLPFKDNVGWIALAYGLADGASSSFTVNTGILEKPLTAGDYRIVKEIGGEAYAVEFAVGESPITAASPHGYAELAALPADYTAAQAEADGVLFTDGGAAIDRFFAHFGVGLDCQLRLGRDDGGLVLTDILAEMVGGMRRIKYTVDATRAGGAITETYYSYLVTDGVQIALSNQLEWGEKQQLLPLPTVTETAIDTVNRKREGALISSLTTANYWSIDGMRAISLRQDSLEFGLSVWYPDGGSSGAMVTLDDRYAMTAIREVVWRPDHERVMFIGDTSMDELMAYVFYNTTSGEVEAYTQSRYGYTIDEDGNILIPE